MITTIDELAKATNPRPWMVMGGNGHETVVDAEGVVFATLYLFSAVELRAFDKIIFGSGYALETIRDLEKRLDAALRERDLYRAALCCRGCGGEGFIESSRYVEGEFGFSGTVEPIWERCPSCREAREKARMG